MADGDPALALIELGGKGLEIGPLYRPRVTKAQGDVRYVDHCPTEELRRIYAHNKEAAQHLDEIVDVDYVIEPGSLLSEVVKGDAPFDYLIASHVVEHVANPIGWLSDVSSVLSNQGLISLVVPDKRYCFDLTRSETRAQDWVDWYFRDLQQPSYGQIFDFYANAVTIDGSVDTFGLWAGTADYTGARRTDVPDPDVAGYKACLDLAQTGRYMDVHTGVYTPQSFLSLVEMTGRLGLLSLEVAHFVPTARNTLEFFVTLRKMSQPLPERTSASVAEALRVEQPVPARPDTVKPISLAPIPIASGPAEAAVAAPAPGGPLSPGSEPFGLSELERSMIDAKRAVMFASRQAGQALRSLFRAGS